MAVAEGETDRFLPALGSYKLTELKPEHFRNLYATLRKQKNSVTGKPLSESTVEGVHACLCGILSDAMEGGFLSQNPAWRTYKYAGKKKQKRNVADEETTKRLIAALEEESIKYETYFKLIIATGMRRGECCKDRTSFDVWWFWRRLSAKIEVFHTSKPNSVSCCGFATTPPYSAATW